MNGSSETEARIRHLEERVLRIEALLRRLSEQVGALAQAANMQRIPTGSGNPNPRYARIAKNGGTAIAAFDGTTMGSGAVTLYNASDTGVLTSAGTVTAWNLGTGTDGPVAANAWLQVKKVDGKWLVDWEQCPA